jgi:hypothetical protein
VRSVELERFTAEGATLTERRNCMDFFRIAALFLQCPSSLCSRRKTLEQVSQESGPLRASAQLREDMSDRSKTQSGRFIPKRTSANDKPHRTGEPLPLQLRKALMAYPTQPEITPNTPLRLADAVKIAFPMGGMTVAGLRRERDCNRLVIEKIAGKEFTTPADIEWMRELCREEARGLDFSLRSPAEIREERKDHPPSNLDHQRQWPGYQHRLRCR